MRWQVKHLIWLATVQPPLLFWLALSLKRVAANVVAGSNPMAVRRGIEAAVDTAVDKLRDLSRPVDSKQDVANVGAISANNDMTIGNLLADALHKVGQDGVITVEEGKTIETTVEYVDGMQFDKGFVSPYFITRPCRTGLFTGRRTDSYF